MLASISKLSSITGAAHYYQQLDKIDDYYTVDNSERPGELHGKIAKDLGLDNPSKFDQYFHNLLKAEDPHGHGKLRQVSDKHTPGWDITFSADKSFSVIWSVSEGQLRKDLEEAFHQSVRKGMEHIEHQKAFTRIGKGGKRQEDLEGLVWAQIRHDTNRNLEPQIHAHNVLFNVGQRKNGKYGAIDSRHIYKSYKEAGLVARAEFARKLENMGFQLELKKHDLIEIKGVPKDLLIKQSSRRQAILEAAAKYGYTTPKGFDKAALRTREKKKKYIDRDQIYAEWKQTAKQYGITVNDVEKLQSSKMKTNVAGKLQEKMAAQGIDYKISTPAKHFVMSQQAQKVGLNIGMQLGKNIKSMTSQLKLIGLSPSPAMLINQISKATNAAPQAAEKVAVKGADRQQKRLEKRKQMQMQMNMTRQ